MIEKIAMMDDGIIEVLAMVDYVTIEKAGCNDL